jgi:hypothetical protein
MRKLKMLDKGPNGNYRRGQVIEVDDLRAVLLIDGGHAVPEGEEVRDDSDTVDTEELQALSGAVGSIGDL